MISEDVKLATTKQNDFIFIQSILHPTPWFFHNEKWKRTYSLLHDFNIKTKMKNSPTNNVKIKCESNQQYQSKNNKDVNADKSKNTRFIYQHTI